MRQKIISYNVNGLRAANAKGLIDWLKDEQPSIVCFQEIKIREDQIDKMAYEFLGYHYQYWNPAVKSGYSGVGIVSKKKADYFATGLGNDKFDFEGRVIRLDFDDISLINSYFPSGTSGSVRQALKMEYLEAFLDYCNHLRKERPNIIVCGDFNIAHKPIDINHPERHKNSSGFLPEERDWMDRFIESGFIDTFREYDKRAEQYSWWSYRMGARSRNVGWRLDYHMITPSLRNRMINAGILQQVVHSDHCPVFVELNI